MYLTQAKSLLQSIFKAHRDNKVSYRFSTAFHGPAGIGKTQMMKAMATEMGMAIVNVRVGQLEPGDLLGIPRSIEVRPNVFVTKYALPAFLPHYLTNEQGEVVEKVQSDGVKRKLIDIELLGDKVDNKKELLEKFDGDLTEIRGVVLFLDEVNRIAGDDTKQAIFQLPEQYALHTYRLPDHTVITAAANPNTNEYQVSEIDQDKAFMDRFLHIKLRPRLEDWMVWAEARGIDPNLISFYNSMPDALFVDEGYYNLNINPSPRSAELIHTLLSEVELPNDDSIRKEVFMGVLGDKIGPLLDKHLKENLDKILSGEEIITEYKKHRKLVLEAIKHNRVDYIDQVNRNIYSYFSDPKNLDTIDQNLKNYTQYMKDIGEFKDVRMSHMKQVTSIKHDGVKNVVAVLSQSDDLYDMLRVDSDEADRDN